MITFKDSKNFTKEELSYINNSSPILQQQSIIPKFELKRLIKDYDNFNQDYTFPDYLILNKGNNFYKVGELKLNNYCISYDGKIFILLEYKYKSTCQSE